MKSLLPVAVVIALGSSGAALAGDDCRRPMAEWQSRDAVTVRATELGLTTERLRIDDGCYELRGRDGDGNRVELTLEPATLAILELEVRFRPGADASRYLPGARAQSGKAIKPSTGKSPSTPIPTAPNPVH